VDTWVIDASVAAKWFLNEDRVKEATSVLVSAELHAPSVIGLELHHTLWAAVRGGRLENEAIQPALERLPRIFVKLHSVESLLLEASRISSDHNHPIYDCAYIAVARVTGSPLLTADERQLMVAKRCRVRNQLL
jgi:predicted nucleic acid-binding protein